MADEMDFLKRISSNPKIFGGKPTIRDTRIPVSLILNLVAHGMTSKQIQKEYPQLHEDDICAALMYAERLVEGEGILDEAAAR